MALSDPEPLDEGASHGDRAPLVSSMQDPTTGAGGHVPLKIGLVTDCYVPRLGGIEMQVHDLAQHLQRAGHQVVVITSTPGPELIDGVRVHRMDVPLLPMDIPYTPATFRLVAELLDRENVDVAHFHGGIVSPLAFVACSPRLDRTRASRCAPRKASSRRCETW